MTTSYNQTLTFTAMKPETIPMLLDANIYYVLLTHKDRANFRQSDEDNINSFTVIAQTKKQALQYVLDWYLNMSQMGLPIEMYDCNISLLISDIKTPAFGVISGVYRW